MPLFAKFDRHSELVGKMADTLGVDVVDAAIRGAVPETALRSSVIGCMSCEETEACEVWLKDHADGADATPNYCRNQAMFERLTKL